MKVIVIVGHAAYALSEQYESISTIRERKLASTIELIERYMSEGKNFVFVTCSTSISDLPLDPEDEVDYNFYKDYNENFWFRRKIREKFPKLGTTFRSVRQDCIRKITRDVCLNIRALDKEATCSNKLGTLIDKGIREDSINPYFCIWEPVDEIIFVVSDHIKHQISKEIDFLKRYVKEIIPGAPIEYILINDRKIVDED